MVAEHAVPADKLFHAMPTWHGGYELFIALLAIIIVTHIFLYAHRMYTLTYRRTVLFFSLAFLLFTVKYILTFGGRYLFYTINNQGLTPMISLDAVSTILVILANTYMLAGLGAVLLLLFVSFKITDYAIIYLSSMVVLLLFLLSQSKVQFYLGLQFLLLLILTAKVIYNSVRKPKMSAQWYAIGVIFLLLAIGDYFAPWSFHFTFTAEIIISLIGFSCIFLSLREIRLQANRPTKQ